MVSAEGTFAWRPWLEMVVFQSQSTRSCQSDSERWKKRPNVYLMAHLTVCSLSPGVSSSMFFPSLQPSLILIDIFKCFSFLRDLSLFPAFLSASSHFAKFLERIATFDASTSIWCLLLMHHNLAFIPSFYSSFPQRSLRISVLVSIKATPAPLLLQHLKFDLN